MVAAILLRLQSHSLRTGDFLWLVRLVSVVQVQTSWFQRWNCSAHPLSASVSPHLPALVSVEPRSSHLLSKLHTLVHRWLHHYVMALVGKARSSWLTEFLFCAAGSQSWTTWVSAPALWVDESPEFSELLPRHYLPRRNRCPFCLGFQVHFSPTVRGISIRPTTAVCWTERASHQDATCAKPAIINLGSWKTANFVQVASWCEARSVQHTAVVGRMEIPRYCE